VTSRRDRSRPDPEEEPTLSLPRVASILGVSAAAVYKWHAEDRLPFAVIELGGRYVVPTIPFLKWLDTIGGLFS
jgi:predicted DNA-binding transcriptional regulator AlpA